MKKIIVAIITIVLLVGCGRSLNSTKKEKDKKETELAVRNARDGQYRGAITFKVNTVNEKHYTKSKKSYAELDLELPQLSGNYKGIDKINAYYEHKYQYFYNNLNMESIELAEEQMLMKNTSM